MKFRTEVNIDDSLTKIGVEDQIFAIGSCFAAEMAQLFATAQMQTMCNPFGTLFNPFSVAHAVEKLHSSALYAEEDLITFNSEFLSLDHHSSFSRGFAHQTLDKINRNIESGNEFLRNTKWILITYGTSFIYTFLPKKKYVANCHKIPARYFDKKFLTHQEITDSIKQTIIGLNDICPDDVQILFTLSPVRHTNDGMSENALSKAKLLTALHEVIPQFENCRYLPVYEIMMDDLRDYRFYKDDMIHPTDQAIQYIWEKFGNAYFSEDSRNFIHENLKISTALEHRSTDEKSPKHLEFLRKLDEKIQAQQAKVRHKIFSKL